MGLLDVLSGMSNPEAGQPAPGSSGGMSPITKAIIGVLAYQAIKAFTGGQASAGTSAGRQSPETSGPGGSLDDLLKGGLGGLLGGGAAGTGVSAGLNDLLKQFQQNGQGDVAKSWIGKGPNKSISPNDLATALGADRVSTLASFSGMSRNDLLNQLSQQLPDVVDQLTPDGRLPTE